MAFSQAVLDALETISANHGIEAAALKAVVEVESGGRAFTKIDGQEMPLILYEYHVFYRYGALTHEQRKEAVRRGLAAPSWGDLPYAKSQTARYNQLKRAAGINEQAAYAACSWGVGQVLGENAEWLGYGTPKAMAERTMQGIEGQVEVMLTFVRKRGISDELNARDWRGFARAYNGKGQVDYYSKRMAAAYRRHAGTAPLDDGPVTLRIGSNGSNVAHLQQALRGLGYFLSVDGDFGPATKRMVAQFQADQGLKADGVAGPGTLGRIEALTGRDIEALAG